MNWGDDWHSIPEEEAAEWDVLYRNVTAFMIRHAVRKAVSVVEFEGERFVCHVNLEPIPDQIN
jgi:hypothetical protein